jgi:hypothetical protein
MSLTRGLRGPARKPRQHSGEGSHQERRRRRESQESGQRSRPASPQHPQSEAQLTARRPRQQLAQRKQLCIGLLAQPPAPLDQLAVKVPEVRDRTAEGCEPESQEDEEDLAGCPRTQHERRAGLDCGSFHLPSVCSVELASPWAAHTDLRPAAGDRASFWRIPLARSGGLPLRGV